MKNRIIYIDYLRVLATISVVVLHVAAQNWGQVEITSFEWHVFNIVDSAVRWAVPIFVMISGALFLDNDKPIDYKRLYLNNIVRLIVAFAFWSFVYSLVKIIYGASITTAMKAFITGNYHMWYIPMMIALYIMIPFIRKITESKKLTEYYLTIGFIFTFFIPEIINHMRHFELTKGLAEAFNAVFSNMSDAGIGYVFYFVLGLYLNKYEIRLQLRKIVYILAVVSCFATTLLTVWFSYKTGTANQMFYGPFTINVLLMAIGIFIYIRYVLGSMKLPERGIKMVKIISKYSFGIYLSHALVLDIFWRNGIDTLRMNSVMAIVVLSVVTLMISLIISSVLSHIPIIRKYVV